MRILGEEVTLTRPYNRAGVALLILCVSVVPVRAAVPETTLCELTAVADFIVIATTVGITEVEGVRLARATVQQSLKGDLEGEFYFLAEGTWSCDISGAEEGERDLLFLNAYEYQTPQKALVSSDEEPNIGVFKEPSRFKSKVSRVTGTSRLLQIAWAGRGQMPLRTVDNQAYVTIWTEDVQLPTSVETIDGPEAEYAEFIRSASLDHISFLVRRYLKTCGRPK
jgi:hypothetical protein